MLPFTPTDGGEAGLLQRLVNLDHIKGEKPSFGIPSGPHYEQVQLRQPCLVQIPQACSSFAFSAWRAR